MKPDNKIKKELPVNKRYKRLTVFVICLLASSLTWMLIKLSKTYEEVIDYPVVFKNKPNDRIIDRQNDTIIYLTVRSQGFKIIYLKYFQKKNPVVIDLHQIKIPQNKNDFEISIPTSKYILNISEQLKFENELISIVPEKIILSLSKVYKKRLKINPDLQLTFAPQYNQYGKVIIQPEFITIYGNKANVDSTFTINTEPIVLNKIKTSIQQSVKVINPLPKILQLSSSKVKIKIDVEQFTESEADVSIQIINLPINTHIKIFPFKLKCLYMVALKDYNKIKAESLNFYVDYSEIKKGVNTLKIYKGTMPEDIKINKIIPEKVEFIIIK